MLVFFLIVAVLAACILLVHVTLEMNRIDTAMSEMIDLLRERYEPR